MNALACRVDWKLKRWSVSLKGAPLLVVCSLTEPAAAHGFALRVSRCQDGPTALHRAIANNRTPIVQFLVKSVICLLH